jgi:hypothetical protein
MRRLVFVSCGASMLISSTPSVYVRPALRSGIEIEVLRVSRLTGTLIY